MDDSNGGNRIPHNTNNNYNKSKQVGGRRPANSDAQSAPGKTDNERFNGKILFGENETGSNTAGSNPNRTGANSDRAYLNRNRADSFNNAKLNPARTGSGAESSTVGRAKTPNESHDESGNGHKSPPKKKRGEHKGLRRFGIIICSIFLVGLISVSSVGLYVLKNMSDFVNGEVAIDLDEYKANQSQTTILYTLDDNGNEVELIRLHGEENRIWVDLDEIPKNLQNAFIAIEDERFETHQGVDWRRTISVIVLPSNEGQGGSTITQQLIKNLTGERDVTYIRKFREIMNALNLEKHYSKETILEAYLNTLYLDAGCYGVQTASEHYFGKNVSELNLAECACIAAITNAPRYYDPIINPENNKERRVMCLNYMLKQGYINQEEYNEAIDFDLVFTTDEDYVPKEDDDKDKDKVNSDGMIDVNENNVGSDGEEVQSYYVDYVIEKVIHDLMEGFSYSYNEAWRLVYYGGLKIHVAVDLDIQHKLEDIYYNRKGFPNAVNSYGEQVQSCMVIMDYTGRVLGIVGQAGEKVGARCLNIATDSKRSPGSSIKPLSIYSLAIDSDMYTWSYPKVQNYGIIVDGERWPFNFGGDPGSPYSYETIQRALAPSHNTVPAQILKEMGIDKSYEWLTQKFKMSIDEEEKTYSSLAVGGMHTGVYALEMCAAYTTFGTGGVYYEPYCYYTVTNSSSSLVYLTHNDEGEQIMDTGSAEVMNKLLQTVTTDYDGTARNYRVTGFDMYAKTGTTSDEKDRWFIGATPYYVCATWMGYSEHAEELSFSTNYCGQLYQTVMNDIHKNLPSKSFEFSDEIVKMSYCTRTGLIASSSCPSAVGWYKTDSIPSTCTSCSGGYTPENNNTPETTAAQSTPTTQTPTTQPPQTQPPQTQPAAASPENNNGNDAD